MKKRTIIILILSILILLGIALINSVSTQRKTRKKHSIICTTTLLADVVRNITQECLEIKTLMKAGVDPHIYQPTPNDAFSITHADIVFHHGLHLEGKLSHVLQHLANKKPVYDVSEGIQKEQLLYTLDNTVDPHIWHDITLWKNVVTYIAQVLSKQFPTHAQQFKKNSARYLHTLTKLDRWVRTTIQTIPKEYRILISAHDAFNYFGRAYGIEVIGIQGINTQAQITSKHIQDIVHLIIYRNVRAIFVEHSTPERTLHAVTQTAHLRGHEVVIGEHLFSDSLDTLDKPTGRYQGMIQHNVTTLVETLGTLLSP